MDLGVGVRVEVEVAESVVFGAFTALRGCVAIDDEGSDLVRLVVG